MDVTAPELHDLKHGWFIGRILLFNGAPQNIYTISTGGYLKLVSTNFCRTTSEIWPEFHLLDLSCLRTGLWGMTMYISKHKATCLYSWKKYLNKDQQAISAMTTEWWLKTMLKYRSKFFCTWYIIPKFSQITHILCSVACIKVAL